MVKIKGKRILSIFLSAIVLVTMCGTGVFAADYDASQMTAQEENAAIDLATKAEVADIPDQVYTGSAIEPEVTVTVGDTVLVKDTDYTVTYKNNVNVTENVDVKKNLAYAIITAVEGSGYTGTIEAAFIIVDEIDDIDLADADVDDIDDQVYDGSAIEPKPVVTYDGETLVEGTHYTLSYENNIELTEEAMVIITAIEGSGYTGSITETFRIVDELPDLSKVKNLKAFSGFKSITLTWDKVEGADTYLVMRTDKKWGEKAEGAYWPRDLYSLKSYKKKWDKISEHPQWENCNKGTVDIYKKYTYKVYAARYVDGATKAGEGQVKIHGQVYEVSQVKTIKKKCVSKLRITVKVTSGTTLTSRDGQNKHLTIHSGDKIVTDGYGAGCYYFDKKGARFRVMNSRVYATNADYVKSSDYSKKEAEYFINNSRLKYARPKATSKKYFVWVSTYNQRVYVFKKSGNKWKLKKSWDCSSGDKNTPSPNGNKSLWKKIRYRHNIYLWNCFSTLNALHGIKPYRYAGYDWNKYLGQIKSGGCVRNADKNAKWLWSNVPIGTRIMVY